MNIEQVVNAVDVAIHKLPYMENLYKQVKDEVNKLQYARQSLVNDIRALEHKISILDKTAFSCEQDCKRTEQKVQEFTDKKDRIEKLIANILNGEGYSKLKQIVKENVKAVLSEKRVLISISFATVIQTLEDNPQMVNLIQNITGANDDKQHKDNHINITQYFEFNKDRILNLGEKTYENLVEELTNDSISSVAASSFSNPASSLSTLPNSFDQSDIYKIRESEIYHNSRGDIAD